MLTRKQHELLMFIHERIKETGVSPSFDEMKEALDLASKSGIHRLITALEVVKLPEQATAARGRQPFRPDVIEGGGRPIAAEPANDTRELSVMGKIAAGTPIAAIEHEQARYPVPEAMLGAGEHNLLEIEGEEATLKRLRKKGASIALEPANRNYETRIFGPDQVEVQGKLVGLIRRYH